MRYSNDLIEGERIYRKMFTVVIKDEDSKFYKFNGEEIIVTCACAQRESKKFYGFSVQSPAEKQTNKMRSLKPARGRLAKAITNNQKIMFPEQLWVSKDQIISFIADVNKKRKNWNGKKE